MAMKAKTIVAVLLMVFVVASIAYALLAGTFAGSGGPDADSNHGGVATGPDAVGGVEDAAQEASHKVVVYYFHGNARCAKCMKFESLTDEVIENFFSEDRDAGILEWRVVNVEDPVNRHFVDDYRLYTKSVVVSDVRDGEQQRFKNPDKIWDLVGSDTEFTEYVRDEIASYLDEV